MCTYLHFFVVHYDLLIFEMNRPVLLSRPLFSACCSPLSCGSFVSPKVRQLSVWLKWQTEHSMVRVAGGGGILAYCRLYP